MKKFKNIKQEKRFAKLISIATIYFQDPEWESNIITYSKEYAINEAKRLKFNDEWLKFSTYEDLKKWFLDNCC